jgi:hypothetical protein
VKCSSCKQTLGARVYVSGRFLCPDCIYELEHGPSPRGEPPERRPGKPPLHPQAERLFPLPPQEKKSR